MKINKNILDLEDEKKITNCVDLEVYSEQMN